MKIRTGFISNSSSSSFIVVFPKKPQSADEVREMMFGEKEYWKGESTKTIAEIVYREINHKEDPALMNKRKLFDFLLGTTGIEEYEEEFDYVEFPEEELKALNIQINEKKWQKVIKNLAKLLDRAADEAAKELFTDDTIICKFQYGDESGGIWGFMEHSDIFHNLPHIRINHH